MNRYDLGFPHDKRVKKFGERVLYDFYDGLLMKVKICRCENGRRGAHVLLAKFGPLNVATEWLKDGL